jgi:thiol-disulfide isomerase/thioredoxin
MLYKPQSIDEFVTILRANNNSFILLVFFMQGCHVCEEMEEYMTLVVNTFNLPVIKLDVSVFGEIANDNNIDKVPTSVLIKFQNDAVVWNSTQFIGLDKNGIESAIRNVIAK